MSPARPSFDHGPASPQSFGSQAQILPHRASAASAYSATGDEANGMLNYSDLAAQSNGEVDGYVAGYEVSTPQTRCDCRIQLGRQLTCL